MFEYIKNRKIQLFVLLFAFQALFILFRGLLIGNNTATNIFELIIATAPDFFICLIFSIALIKFNKDDFKSEKIVLFDVLILIFFVSNILLISCFVRHQAQYVYKFMERMICRKFNLLKLQHLYPKIIQNELAIELTAEPVCMGGKTCQYNYISGQECM